MKCLRKFLATEHDWTELAASKDLADASLVFGFGSLPEVARESTYDRLRRCFPKAQIVLASGGGVIHDAEVRDEGLAIAALEFEQTRVRGLTADFIDFQDLEESGRRLGTELNEADIAGVFVLCDGLSINGSALVRGLRKSLPAGVTIAGGLAIDGPEQKASAVGLNSVARRDQLVAVAFYGSAFQMRSGSFDGCRPFGPEGRITRSAGNVLFELDGEPALDLFERFLGDEAKYMPGSALQFPLKVRNAAQEAPGFSRTVMAVDRDARSLTFCGDIPEGHHAQIMRASLDRLVEGAGVAALQARSSEEPRGESLAILVSCIGRRIAYGSRIEAELDAVEEILGAEIPRIGFYSNGEIAPCGPLAPAELLNHTMTIFMLSESPNPCAP